MSILIQKLVNLHGDYNAVLQALNGQLGAEGRALVKTMVMLKDENEGENDEDT